MSLGQFWLLSKGYWEKKDAEIRLQRDLSVRQTRWLGWIISAVNGGKMTPEELWPLDSDPKPVEIPGGLALKILAKHLQNSLSSN